MFFIDFNYAKASEAAGRATARFDFSKFTDFSDLFHEPITSHFITQVKRLRVFGEYKVTSEEGRPDLISYNVYGGDTQFWWIIMHYNSVVTVDQIVNSMTLAYPSLADVESLYYTLPGLARQ